MIRAQRRGSPRTTSEGLPGFRPSASSREEGRSEDYKGRQGEGLKRFQEERARPPLREVGHLREVERERDMLLRRLEELERKRQPLRRDPERFQTRDWEASRSRPYHPQGGVEEERRGRRDDFGSREDFRRRRGSPNYQQSMERAADRVRRAMGASKPRKEDQGPLFPEDEDSEKEEVTDDNSEDESDDTERKRKARLRNKEKDAKRRRKEDLVLVPHRLPREYEGDYEEDYDDPYSSGTRYGPRESQPRDWHDDEGGEGWNRDSYGNYRGGEGNLGRRGRTGGEGYVEDGRDNYREGGQGELGGEGYAEDGREGYKEDDEEFDYKTDQNFQGQNEEGLEEYYEEGYLGKGEREKGSFSKSEQRSSDTDYPMVNVGGDEDSEESKPSHSFVSTEPKTLPQTKDKPKKSGKDTKQIAKDFKSPPVVKKKTLVSQEEMAEAVRNLKQEKVTPPKGLMTNTLKSNELKKYMLNNVDSELDLEMDVKGEKHFPKLLAQAPGKLSSLLPNLQDKVFEGQGEPSKRSKKPSKAAAAVAKADDTERSALSISQDEFEVEDEIELEQMQRILHESRVTAVLEEERRQRAWAELGQAAPGPSKEGGNVAQDNLLLAPHPLPAKDKDGIVSRPKTIPKSADSGSQAKKSSDK